MAYVASAGSPFLTAARDGDIETLKSLLEDKTLDLEQRNQYGDTALILAALNNQVEAVRLLLDHGAKIDAIGSFGNTALISASRKESAELLVERGANLKIKNKFGRTAQRQAKHYAKTIDYPEMKEKAQFLKAAAKKAKGPSRVSRIAKKLGL